jgi:serine/threonine protein kinase/tetratricopeptide (TPR) repeat protein
MDLQDIFFGALECSTPEQRKLFLAASCAGRPEIQVEVEAMLRKSPQLPTYLERSAFSDISAREALVPNKSDVQRQIGSRFRIAMCLGEGGMGSVWLARQTDPIERDVAIKFLRPGFDSQKILARFEVERNILAKAQHPNIAAIFDAGTTADGRPYFVMEYCGVSGLVDHVSTLRLGLRDRLELFIQVCRAVDHVHRLGILHRDIKPSNVLVAHYNQMPVAKVIDFGIAKMVGEAVVRGDKRITPSGLTGTPEYMAPELITGQPATPLSDVYSLGAMLYELLAGWPPYGKSRFDQPGLLDYAKRVEQTDPEPPSRAIDRSSDTVATDEAVANCFVPIAEELPRQIDWIVMKAIERDPHRRYQDVASLQADLQRFLAGEVVKAPSLSLFQRFPRRWRWSRNPATAASILLAAGLLVCAFFWSDLLGKTSLKTRGDAAESGVAFDSQQKRAGRLEKAFIEDLRGEVVDTMQRIQQADRTRLEAERKRLRYLAGRWELFANSLGSDRGRQVTLAECNFRMGQIYGAIGEPDRAIEMLCIAEGLYQGVGDQIHSSPLQSVYRLENLGELGRRQFDKGSPTDALSSFSKAISLAKELPFAEERQKEWLQSVSEIYADRAKVLLRSGRSQEALSSVEEAMAYLRELEEVDKNNDRTQQLILSTLNGRSFILRSLGQIEASIVDIRAGQDRIALMGDNATDPTAIERLRGTQYLNLGLALHSTRRHEEAVVEFANAKAVFEELVRTYPSSSGHRERLAASCNSMGVAEFLTGEVDKGAADCESAALMWKQLASQHPEVPEYTKSALEVETNLAVMAARAMRFDIAEGFARRAMESGQRLAESFPEVVDFAIVSARSHTILAGIQSQQGDAEAAIATLGDAIRLFELAADRYREAVALKDGLAVTLATRGDMWSKRHEYGKSLDDYEAAVELVEMLPGQSAGVTQVRHLADLQTSCAQMCSSAGDSKQAMVWLQRVEETLQRRLGVNPGDDSLKEQLRQVTARKAELMITLP